MTALGRKTQFRLQTVENAELQSDKLILPASCFKTLCERNIAFPYTFKCQPDIIINTTRSTPPNFIYAGVLEFSAPEASVSVPTWLLDHLGLVSGAWLLVCVQRLPTGVSALFQPSAAVDLDTIKPL